MDASKRGDLHTHARQLGESSIKLDTSLEPWQRFITRVDDWSLVTATFGNLLFLSAVVASASRLSAVCSIMMLLVQAAVGIMSMSWRKRQPQSYFKWRNVNYICQRALKLCGFWMMAAFVRGGVQSRHYQSMQQCSGTEKGPLCPGSMSTMRVLALASLTIEPISHYIQSPLPTGPQLAVLFANLAITIRILLWPIVAMLSVDDVSMWSSLCNTMNTYMRFLEKILCCIPQDRDYFDSVCSTQPLMPLVLFLHLFCAVVLPVLFSICFESYMAQAKPRTQAQAAGSDIASEVALSLSSSSLLFKPLANYLLIVPFMSALLAAVTWAGTMHLYPMVFQNWSLDVTGA